MIGNIRDHRKHIYRWKSVDAVVEALEHDNAVQGADQAEPGDPDHYVSCDWRTGISLEDAISWAHQYPYKVALYIYDEGASGLGD
ncbi:MAG: hypothetical protein AAF687_12210 [Pseudomonadota bacterium]